VLGYERDQQDNGTFLLGRWDEQEWTAPQPLVKVNED
jgi:hypothetical protein